MRARRGSTRRRARECDSGSRGSRWREGSNWRGGFGRSAGRWSSWKRAQDPREKLEAAVLAAEIDRVYLEWGLEEIRGLEIDGEAATPAALIEKGPLDLATEILARIKRGVRSERRPTKKLIVAFHFLRGDGARWECDACRRQGLEARRRCGFLPEERRGAKRIGVGARAGVDGGMPEVAGDGGEYRAAGEILRLEDLGMGGSDGARGGCISGAGTRAAEGGIEWQVIRRTVGLS